MLHSLGAFTAFRIAGPGVVVLGHAFRLHPVQVWDRRYGSLGHIFNFGAASIQSAWRVNPLCALCDLGRSPRGSGAGSRARIATIGNALSRVDPGPPLDLDGSGSPAEVKADGYSPSFRVWYTGFEELRGLNAAESRTDAIMFPLVTGMMACDPIRLQKIPQ